MVFIAWRVTIVTNCRNTYSHRDFNISFMNVRCTVNGNKLIQYNDFEIFFEYQYLYWFTHSMYCECVKGKRQSDLRDIQARAFDCSAYETNHCPKMSINLSLDLVVQFPMKRFLVFLYGFWMKARNLRSICCPSKWGMKTIFLLFIITAIYRQNHNQHSFLFWSLLVCLTNQAVTFNLCVCIYSLDAEAVWNGSFRMYLSKSASLFGSTWDSCENPSSSTKQISSSFGSDKMITRTVALPGVANEISGVRIVCFVSIIIWLISACKLYGTAKAMRPKAFLRSIGESKPKLNDLKIN